ncbi:alginate lyase family protein [Neolewinella lacunae]|uniref:Alginate lyase family protein n=1 Tax=Neolewinella lacunae TaxID=1517758 RepID=A0A923PR24_9BACT|nr:alginate lyase family protein [Neolewinella lacunae]MBC6995182.1 alginate lyase family protein [Neolewinella lacunae]MDN3634132.1 alginate lyase family protein [Neolewinella lacunae]
MLETGKTPVLRPHCGAAFALLLLLWLACGAPEAPGSKDQIAGVLRDSLLLLAAQNLHAAPETVTSSRSPRSAGGPHDFYSEGDYWWPDSLDPAGPYVRRDGLTNPENFLDHRRAVVRLSEIVGNLASAYLLTKDERYAAAARQHLRAWFLTDSTRMNPHLLYAQAIQGRFTGRGIGIIDGIHFMEVVQATRILEKHGQLPPTEFRAIQDWFTAFVGWLSTHPYGIEERDHPNNHGTCWNMQVGLYAVFTGQDSLAASCRERYRSDLLPRQMAADGSFPLELERTKPYGYSLFNLDAMAMNCLVLSTATEDLWTYTAPDGENLRLGLEYLAPYVADKSAWPLPPDVMYWENWPVAQPALLFGGLRFGRPEWIEIWSQHAHFPTVEEVRRNLPIRNPLLWLDLVPVAE